MAIKALPAPGSSGVIPGRRVDGAGVDGAAVDGAAVDGVRGSRRAAQAVRPGAVPAPVSLQEQRTFSVDHLSLPEFDSTNIRAQNVARLHQADSPRRSAPAQVSPPKASDIATFSTPEVGSTFDEHAESAQNLAMSVRNSRTNVKSHAASFRPAGAAAPQGGLRYRFTDRGMRVLVALGFIVSIGIGAIVGTALSDEIGTGITATVVVDAGDSLWSIASSLTSPGEDVRPMLREIMTLNELTSTVLVAGQSLTVPSK